MEVIALHVAAGRPWFGRRVHRCGVLYVSAEGGTSIKKRLAAACERLGINIDEIDFGAVIAPTNLLDTNGIDQLIADARAVPNIGLIIIDTASRVMPGGKEDTEAMSLFVRACDIVRNVVGAAILVIHHTGKDQTRGSRGGSGLPAAADAVAAFSQEGKIRNIELANARDGEIGPIGSFVLGVVDLGIDDDGDPITSCVVEPNGATEPSAKPEPKPKPKLNARDQIALDTLRQALAAHGTAAPAHNYIPSSATVILVDLWRRFYLAATSNNNDVCEDSRDRAFRRCRESLQGKSIIRVWEQMVWQV